MAAEERRREKLDLRTAAFASWIYQNPAWAYAADFYAAVARGGVLCFTEGSFAQYGPSAADFEGAEPRSVGLVAWLEHVTERHEVRARVAEQGLEARSQ